MLIHLTMFHLCLGLLYVMKDQHLYRQSLPDRCPRREFGPAPMTVPFALVGWFFCCYCFFSSYPGTESRNTYFKIQSSYFDGLLEVSTLCHTKRVQDLMS